MLTDAPLHALFSGEDPHKGDATSHQRQLMDDLALTPDQMSSPIFSGAEEVFAFQRALSRLMEMQSQQVRRRRHKCGSQNIVNLFA